MHNPQYRSSDIGSNGRPNHPEPFRLLRVVVSRRGNYEVLGILLEEVLVHFPQMQFSKMYTTPLVNGKPGDQAKRLMRSLVTIYNLGTSK
jgi:hypothetical protein